MVLVCWSDFAYLLVVNSTNSHLWREWVSINRQCDANNLIDSFSRIKLGVQGIVKDKTKVFVRQELSNQAREKGLGKPNALLWWMDELFFQL